MNNELWTTTHKILDRYILETYGSKRDYHIDINVGHAIEIIERIEQHCVQSHQTDMLDHFIVHALAPHIIVDTIPESFDEEADANNVI